LSSALKVGIEARLPDGSVGGIMQMVIGLAQGLACLEDGDEEYYFHVYPDSSAWIDPYLKGNCRRLEGAPAAGSRVKHLLKSSFLKLPLQYLKARFANLPASDGILEAEGCEVIHFPYQGAFRTALPNIYQPHDFQHLHYPEFFSPVERARRQRIFPAAMNQASLVVLMTPWGRRDLLAHYDVPKRKAAVIAGGAVTAQYPSPGEDEKNELRLRLKLEDAFFVYPAKAFPHKNHMALVEALAWMRDQRKLYPQVVCTGSSHPHMDRVKARVAQLGLQKQWVDAGYLSPTEMNALYAMARAMVFPSKFEGWGLPVTEAFERGLPLACSNATALPDNAGDAALFFSPDDIAGMGEAMERLWTDSTLRAELIQRGRLRSEFFSWERAAKIYRAWYRYLSKRVLNDEDRQLVAGSLEIDGSPD
jgi:glycosyltransferase involved in cell wall biosynthesis